jgi:hypothetical protein
MSKDDPPIPIGAIGARRAFEEAFQLAGGVPKLVAWARSHRTQFYTIFGKLVTSPAPTTVSVNINHAAQERNELREVFSRIVQSRSLEDTRGHVEGCACAACKWRRQNIPALSDRCEIAKTTVPSTGPDAGHASVISASDAGNTAPVAAEPQIVKASTSPALHVVRSSDAPATAAAPSATGGAFEDRRDSTQKFFDYYNGSGDALPGGDAVTARLDQQPDETRNAGITDADWWEWFGRIDGSHDPWWHWLAGVRFPRETIPPHDRLEIEITTAIKAADALRLSITPQTARFDRQWMTFRRYHEDLDQGGKYRRKRFMVWRAAALKVFCERDYFQDKVADAVALGVLIGTMRWFAPNLMFSGDYYEGGNFWQPRLVECSDGVQQPLDAFAGYAAMVLTLMRRALSPEHEPAIPREEYA